MTQYIPKSALMAEILKRREINKKNKLNLAAAFEDNYLLSFLDTLEVKECETKSGIVQEDLQIILDDGTYIDLDPSMQLKPSFSVKEGERVKVVISKED